MGDEGRGNYIISRSSEIGVNRAITPVIIRW